MLRPSEKEEQKTGSLHKFPFLPELTASVFRQYAVTKNITQFELPFLPTDCLAPTAEKRITAFWDAPTNALARTAMSRIAG